METKHDSEFGAMTRDGGDWRIERAIVFAGQDVPIEVEPDENDNFEAGQRQAMRLALALGPDAAEEAAPSVVQNYEVYREALGEEETPQLERLVDVWQQVRIKCIYVPRHHEAQNAYFQIQAECDWDPEHGLWVRFRNGVAIEASQAGEIGGIWDDTPEYLEGLRQSIEAACATALKKPGQQT